MRITEFETIPRRKCVVFFLVQASGGMHGITIASINQAMSEAFSDLKTLQNEYPEAHMQVAAMSFSSQSEWCLLPTDVDSAEWTGLYASGLSCFGAACDNLNHNLSREKFMDSPTGYYAPIIIPIVMGEPCDDYITSIEGLKKNKWFDSALKTAVLLSDYGDETEDEICDKWLAHFTGTKESILKVEAPVTLGNRFDSKLIQSVRIALRASIGAIWEKRWMTGNIDPLTPHGTLIELIHQYKRDFESEENRDG